MTSNLRTELIERAQGVRSNAYAPYSEYAVGAALLTNTGKIFTGVNVENASYPLSMCAERNSIFKAVSEGERQFDMIVVATHNGGSPCGACRQVLAEFGLETRVMTVDADGEVVLDMTVRELLPEAFRPEDLG
ncbi:MAG: cytidine deaminase [Anaerolineales bacterium]|nr:cytidine deaminase [Anaerolineales bacterium]